MPLTNAELVQRTLGGDKSAFEELVRKYMGSVEATIGKRCDNYHDRQEIMQETFITAHQKLPDLKAPDKFPGWLTRIAIRKCLQWYNHQESHESFDDTAEETHEQLWMKHIKESTDASIREKLLKELHDKIADLPEKTQTAVRYHIMGCKNKDIAMAIGVSPSAIGGRLSYAKELLGKEEWQTFEESQGRFQLLPTVAQDIMRRLPGPPNSAPTTSPPLVPWIIADSLALGIALFIGSGIGQPATFQPPPSFDASGSATIVEFVDAP